MPSTRSTATKDIIRGLTALIFIALGYGVYKLFSLFVPVSSATMGKAATPPEAEHVYQDIFNATRGTRVTAPGQNSAIVYIGGKKYAYMKDSNTGAEIFIPIP